MAWMSISCTENGPEQDSTTAMMDTEMVDSVTTNTMHESTETSAESENIESSAQSNPSDRIEDAQQKLRDQLAAGNNDQSQSEPKYRLNVEPYNYFADKEGYVSFKGRELSEIQQILGDAPIIVKQSIAGAPIRKEVRVYMPYKEDATGLYLFIQNEIVQDFRLDEFNGIQNSSILEFFESR
ncbi:MAG TPA: hypothetical protein DCE78_08640 [Bacteroidetes bacterium]|nr:hypothetical protein [Bacteroidota bacterium]